MAQHGFVDLEEFESGDPEEWSSIEEYGSEETIQNTFNRVNLIEKSFPQLTGDSPDVGFARSTANAFFGGLSSIGPAAFKTLGLMQSKFREWQSGGDVPVETTPYYLMGETLNDALEVVFPENPEHRERFLTGTLPNATGMMTTQVLAAVGSGGVAAGLFTNSMIQAGMSSQFYEEAKGEGADDEEAFNSTLLNLGGALGLEAIPIGFLLKRVDKATGGGIKEVLKNGFRGSVEEGVTEGLQQFYSNAVANNVYEANRDILDGVGESVLLGGLLGGTANVMTTAIVGARLREGDPDKQAALEMEALNVSEIAQDKKARDELSEFFSSLEDPEGLQIGVTETADGVALNKDIVPIRERSKFRRLREKWLSYGNVDKRIENISQQEKAWADGQIAKAEVQLTRLNGALLETFSPESNSIKEAFQKGEITQGEIDLVDSALRGEESSLPDNIQEAVSGARQHIDSLSQTMIDRGYVSGKLSLAMTANKGSYLHRAYRRFTPGVEWAESNIPKEVWNNALMLTKEQLIEQIPEGDKANMNDAQLSQEADRIVRQLIHTDSLDGLYGAFKEYKKAANAGNMDTLLQREDVPAEIRALFGEYTDPRFNYINTVEKMTRTISKRGSFDRMVDMFDGIYFRTEEQTFGEADYQDWVKPPENWSGVRSKIEKRWMHKDLFEQLNEVNKTNEDQPGWVTGLLRANFVAKFTKTALSTSTVARNVLGGFWFLGNSGLLFNPKKYSLFANSARMAFQSWSKLDKKGLAEEAINMHELGLVGKSSIVQEFLGAMADAKLADVDVMESEMRYAQSVQDFRSLRRGVGNLFKRGTKRASDFYGAGDDAVRMFQFQLEKARYKDLGVKKSDGEIAQIVLDTYQNYDRVPKFGKSLRNMPIAPFISFSFEVVRTSINNAVLAKQEIESSDRRVNKSGYQRLAGITGSTISYLAMGAASQAMFGISDDDDEAYREMMPHWDKTSTLLYGPKKPGQIMYMNLERVNPYGIIIDPLVMVQQGLSEGEIMETFVESAKVMMEPILTPEIASAAAIEALSNTRFDTGTELYNPEDDLGTKMSKSLAHLWRAVEPGTISSMKRVYKDVTESDVHPIIAGGGMIGGRFIPLDLQKSFGFGVRDLRQRVRNTRRAYNSVKYNESSTPDEINEAFQVMNDHYFTLYQDMRSLYLAGLRTKVPDGVLTQTMKDGGLSQRDIDAVKRGVFQPFER